MDTNSNNYRRTFLKKCMALTAGATVLGSGIKVAANPTDEWRWVAYCGLKCDNSCSWFKNNQCPSCKSVSYNCTVQKCARKKQVPTCAHCGELDTCDDPYWTKHPSQYKDIKALRDSLSATAIDTQSVDDLGIVVYPNPAQNYLTIQNKQHRVFSYELVNINGQILKKGTIENSTHTFDISDLKSGNYLFKLIRNSRVLQLEKVVKL